VLSALMNQDQTLTVSNFLSLYERYLEADSSRSADRIMTRIASIFDGNISLSYSGQPGLVSDSYGVFSGKSKALKAIKDFRSALSTKRFAAQEIIDNAFSVDFSNTAQPLTPLASKVAIIAEQDSRSIRTGLGFRLDNVIYLEVGENNLITGIDISYDSYLMSEAITGRSDQVPNPDIEDIINKKRDSSTTIEQTITGSLNFFGAFAGVQSAEDLDILTGHVTTDVAVKFGGDPEILPFADKKIRVGKSALVRTFTEQLNDSIPRIFDINEIFVKGDRFISNTFEGRTAVPTGRDYDIPVNILFTVSGGTDPKVSSIEGIFDSSITTTAFTGQYPFPVQA